MPRLVHKLPSYRLHKASGQAIVNLGGRDIYLGPYNSRLSRAEYDRVVAEWLANGRRLSTSTSNPAEALSVSEMILRYWVFAKQHYRRNGQPTRELDSNSRPLERGSSLLAHFDSDRMMRHHRDVEKG